MDKIRLSFFLTLFVFLLGNMPTSSQAATSLYVGQSTILSAPNPPSGAALNQTAWGCSNSHISVEKYMTYGAKVTVNSYFTGTAEVRCDYYYYWYDNYGYMHTNNATTYFQITCNPVTLSISPSSMTMAVGEGQSISYSYSPSNVSPKPTIRFLSSNTNVATVNDNGYVKAVGPGNATITIENSSGPNATCSVKVNSPNPTGISLPNTLSLIVGESKTITPTVYPSGANYSLTWSSNDVSIATVSSSGLVTGKKAGTARITATINGYSYSDYCNVTVEKPTLTLSVSPSSGLLEKGTTITLTASNSNASIYYTLDGNSPNQNSIKYNVPIVINQNLTLKAIAYHEDYNASSILAAKYEVTSLKVVSTNPENGATDLGRNTIPSVTFNTEIMQGEKFEDIKLTRNGTEEVAGEKIICGNMLYYVPQEDLSTARYSLLIPSKSLKNDKEESNMNTKLSFSAVGIPSYPHVGQGASYMGVLKSDGTLWIWGKSLSTPQELFSNVRLFSIGGGHIMFVKNDNSLWLCGDNSHGQIGNSSTSSVSIYSPVKIMDDVLAIAAGYNTSYAVKTDGSLWAWGGNQCGQIGDGTTTDRKTPLKIIGENITKVYAGDYTVMVITKSDQMMRWGRISAGGRQTEPSFFMSDVLYATINPAFGYNSMAIKKDYSLWEINNSDYSQIIQNVIHADRGNYQALALKDDNSLWIWGGNDHGQLGIGTTSTEWLKANQAIKVMDDVQYAWTGYWCCAAIKQDGSVWTWGRNDNYQLGDGTKNDSNVPVKIMEVPEISYIDNVAIASDNYELHVGEKTVIQSILNPIKGKYDSMTWSIDDESIASISQRGVVTAKYPGTTVVRLEVKANNETFTCSHHLTVTEASGIFNAQQFNYSIRLDNSNLHIDNIGGEIVTICNSSGIIIYHGTSKSSTLNVPLPAKGVYVIKVGKSTTKIVYR